MKVELRNITKIFPSRNKKSGEEVVAVNDFTFEIPDGKLKRVTIEKNPEKGFDYRKITVEG